MTSSKVSFSILVLKETANKVNFQLASSDSSTFWKIFSREKKFVMNNRIFLKFLHCFGNLSKKMWPKITEI